MVKGAPRAVSAQRLLEGSRKVMPERNVCPEATRRLDSSENVTWSSLMVQSFSPYAKALSLFGCFFILNFEDLNKARVTWRSLYTLYSSSWVVLLVAVDVWVRAENTVPQDAEKMFTGFLLATVNVSWIITSFVNWSCILLGSSKLLDVFRKAALFEASSGICLAQKNAAKGIRFRTLRKVGVVTSATITLGFCVFLTIEDSLKGREKTWSGVLPKMLLRLLCQVAFCFYEGIMYITVSNVCEIMVFYIRAQESALRDGQRLVRKDHLDELSAGLLVEAIRKNMCTIRMLKTCFNAIWAPAIVVCSVCFIWVHCITWYCLFTNDAYRTFLWLGLAYSGYNTLRFLDLAVISHELSNEARSIQDAAKDATFTQVGDSYVQQIQFLHDSIDPERMRLSGAEFFYLDRRLLVSIAGSVITYTVILVQTNHGLSPRARTDMVNKGT